LHLGPAGAHDGRFFNVRRNDAIRKCQGCDMKFIEMTGKTLRTLVSDDELHVDDLSSAGVYDDTIVRVNQQGDIEVRRHDRWDVIGGLLGNYELRMKNETGLDWAE
jgi:hypothetical protein